MNSTKDQEEMIEALQKAYAEKKGEPLTNDDVRKVLIRDLKTDKQFLEEKTRARKEFQEREKEQMDAIIAAMSKTAVACAIETHSVDTPHERKEEIDDLTDLMKIQKLEAQIEALKYKREKRARLRQGCYRNVDSFTCGLEVDQCEINNLILKMSDDNLRNALDEMSDEELETLRLYLEKDFKDNSRPWLGLGQRLCYDYPEEKHP